MFCLKHYISLCNAPNVNDILSNDKFHFSSNFFYVTSF